MDDLQGSPDFRPTERFSNRVDDYARHRPSYPAQVFDFIRDELAIPQGATVVDVGAGTGIFSHLLLERGYRVLAVEPNAEMRSAAELKLSENSNFTSVNGSAEATTIKSGAADLVTVAQAFHWFDAAPTRAEFVRILKPAGQALLVWNDRKLTGSPFLEAYEHFLQQFGVDYSRIAHRTQQAIQSAPSFFDPGTAVTRTYPSEQVLDRNSFLGRVFSSSFVPGTDHPDHLRAKAALEKLFEAYNKNGLVTFVYATRVFAGRVS